jgi:hypothetical protein
MKPDACSFVVLWVKLFNSLLADLGFEVDVDGLMVARAYRP